MMASAPIPTRRAPSTSLFRRKARHVGGRFAAEWPRALGSLLDSMGGTSKAARAVPLLTSKPSASAVVEYPCRSSLPDPDTVEGVQVRSDPLQPCLNAEGGAGRDLGRIHGLRDRDRASLTIGGERTKMSQRSDRDNESCRIRNIMRSAARIPVRTRPLDGRLKASIDEVPASLRMSSLASGVAVSLNASIPRSSITPPSVNSCGLGLNAPGGQPLSSSPTASGGKRAGKADEAATASEERQRVGVGKASATRWSRHRRTRSRSAKNRTCPRR